MSIEIKIFSYWIIILLVLFVAAKIKLWLSGECMYFKYWIEHDWIGNILIGWLVIGLTIIVGYLFIIFSMWYFN